MTDQAVDRNLLFGILALQMDFIDRDALVAAMNAWVLEKAKPLGRLLVERGAMTEDEFALIEPLVARHIEKHGGEPKLSVASLDPDRSAREALAQVPDPDLQASLAHLASRPDEDDPYATRSYSAAAPTPDRARFRVLHFHAKGGLGVVSVALDTELDRQVALKEIQGEHADEPESRSRFVQEAEITGKLEHPGIIPVYGLGHYADGRPFYAMRFIRGDSLRDAIGRFHRADVDPRRDPGERALRLRELLGRFLDVCNAIAYAHSRGVLHRDLKPGNIMLGPYGETLVVDWGLAKPTGRADAAAGATLGPVRLSGTAAGSRHETMGAVGTPAYMAPEQAGGRLEALGPASDVFSLGATLYHLLTGRAPYHADDGGPLLPRVARGDFPPPRLVKPGVPRPLEAICLKAMATKPEDRYTSPRELADDIERWVADEPVTAYADPLWVRLGRWSRRHRVAATTFVALLAVLVPGLLAANALLQREKRRAEENFRQTRAAIRRFVALADEHRFAGTADDLRRAIGVTAKDYYEEFLRGSSGDPSLMAELAWAHFELTYFILLDMKERVRQFRMQSPPPPGAPGVARLPSPETLPSWPADLKEAILHNKAALSIYSRLIERYRAPKEREYQMCQRQQAFLNKLLNSPDLSEALISSSFGPDGSVEPGSAYTMIGD